MNFDEAPEWMKLLRSSDDSNKAATEAKEEERREITPPEDVVNEGDAEELLLAVKERLGDDADGSERYQEFLTAISAEPVDYESAAAVVADYPDLTASFQKCFGGATAAASPAASGQAAPAAMEVTEEILADHRGSSARIGQLVQLVFGNKVGHEKFRAQMQEYASKRAQQPAYPRRLILLRGPPGSGKSTWAENSLVEKAGVAAADLPVARLTHLCSANDFFMQFASQSSDELKYVYDPKSSRAHEFANQARVRLAMEASIEPLYVDNHNMTLSEMRPYVKLADRFGYVITVIAPHEITPNWADLDFLLSRCTAKRVLRQTVDKAISAYEDLTSVEDPRPAILAAEQPDDEDGDGQPATLLAPAAMLYKFEQLLKEGENILRYVPPVGKGWGVNGELGGEWHSFREKVDGSCTYDDGRSQWYTADPEIAWSFADVAMLDDLKKQTAALPQASIPSATSHPSLFGNKTAQRTGLAEPVAATPADAKKEEEEEEDDDKEMPAMSRKERFRKRVMMKMQEAADSRKAAKNTKAATTPSQPAVVPLPKPGVPTSQEESSAAAFMASVKCRLMEWGKAEQYRDFLVALSGTVDAKAAVRILRGHDDLLEVFKRDFAPRADLTKIKAEIEADVPHPPVASLPGSLPPARGVKQESGAKTGKKRPAPSTPAASPAPDGGPRPPMGPPPLRVKTEGGRAPVKAELGQDEPRPPSLPPGAPRGNITIGDDDEEEVPQSQNGQQSQGFSGKRAKTLPWMRVKAEAAR